MPVNTGLSYFTSLKIFSSGKDKIIITYLPGYFITGKNESSLCEN